MSRPKFKSLFPKLGTLIGASESVAIAGEDNADPVTMTASELEASIQEDMQTNIEKAVAAAKAEFETSGASASDERKRWSEVISNRACASNLVASTQLLNKTDMSASDIIETVEGMKAQSGLSEISTSDNVASNRLAALQNDEHNRVDTGPASTKPEEKSALELRSENRAKAREERNKKAMEANPLLAVTTN